MSISVQCSCGKQFVAPDKLAGQRVKCPGCQQPLLVSSPSNIAVSSNIPVRCSCGKSLAAPAKLAGKTLKCPGCGQPIAVPAAEPGTTARAITVACDCGHSFSAPAKFAGRQVRCPACKQPTSVPAVKTESVPAGIGGRRPTEDVGHAIGSLLDEVGFQKAAAAHRCPNCKEDLLPGAILCIHCGFNLETGRQIQTKVVRKKTAERRLTSPKEMSGKAQAEAKDLASRHKGLLICVYLTLANILVGIAVIATFLTAPDQLAPLESLATIPQITGLLAFLMAPVVTFRLAGKLTSSTTAIMLGLLSLVPLVGLIVMLVLSNMATKELQQNGFKVGFLGAKA